MLQITYVDADVRLWHMTAIRPVLELQPNPNGAVLETQAERKGRFWSATGVSFIATCLHPNTRLE
jgi:hypothetical protein